MIFCKFDTVGYFRKQYDFGFILPNKTHKVSLDLKKIKIVCFLLFVFSTRAFAPVRDSLIIIQPDSIQPYKHLEQVIGIIETYGDTLAYNPLEEAYGIFQIRPVRLMDFNLRTKSNYTSTDLFNYQISEKIFLYYASQIGPYNFEKIARRWNGSGEQTDYYWERVRELL
jgi:hypothetical protein